MKATTRNKNDGPRPWAAVAESAKYEDCIIGNRVGLAMLRDKIEEAFEGGSAELPKDITNCTCIVLVKEPENPEQIREKRTWRDVVGVIGIFAFLLAMLAVFLVGVGTISGWWK